MDSKSNMYHSLMFSDLLTTIGSLRGDQQELQSSQGS